MSVAAKAVAQEVIRQVGKGVRPNITKIAISKGYKPSVARNGKVTKTKAYREIIIPFVDKLAAEREAAIDRMKSVRSKAKYRDLAYAADILTKNHQLLTGGATSNIAVGVRKLNDADLERIATGGKTGTSEEGTSEA